MNDFLGWNFSERKEKAKEIFNNKNNIASNIFLFFDFLFNKESKGGLVIIIIIIILTMYFKIDFKNCNNGVCKNPISFEKNDTQVENGD